ncbi:hypothetical protein ACFFRR_011443 [Megaselia abdita]
MNSEKVDLSFDFQEMEDTDFNAIEISSEMLGSFFVLKKSKLFNEDVWSTFKEHEIDNEALRGMTSSTLEQLLPKLGHQIKFEGERKRWLQNPRDYENEQLENVEDSFNAMCPFEAIAQNFEDEFFDVEIILNQLMETSVLLKNYKMFVENNTHRPLLKNERRLVCNTINNWLIHRNINLRRLDYIKIRDKVFNVFKRESIYLWYKPAFSKNVNGVLKHSGPSGILWTSYSYRRTKKIKQLQKLGQSTDCLYRNKMKLNKKTLMEEEISDETDCFNIQKWLQENFTPWDTIKSNWRKTCAFRRSHIVSKENQFFQILDMWPRLRKQHGFELIDIDFESLYPEKSGNLKHLWHRYSDKLLKMAYECAKAKSRKDKDAMAKFSQEAPTQDEEQNFKGSLSLHALFYLCPNKKKNCAQDLKKMFRQAQRGSKIDEEILKISEAAAKNGEPAMNPFVLFFINDANMPYKFFVCVNHLIYELSSFVEAIDILFKSYFVFNLNYPPESENVLRFIQHFFYQVFLNDENISTSIYQLMYDLDIDRAEECQQILNQLSCN